MHLTKVAGTILVLLMVACGLSAVCGGVSASPPTWTNDVSKVLNLAHPSVVVDDDDLAYVFGGELNTSAPANIQDKAYRYNTKTGAWSDLAPLPAPVYGAASVIGPNGDIYVMCGYQSSSVGWTDLNRIYDPDTNTWALGAPAPEKLWCASAILGGDGMIYLIGGKQANSAASSDVYVYDPDADSWTTGPSLPSGRYGGAVFSDGYVAYYMGGLDSGGQPTDTVFFIDLGHSWGTIDPMPFVMGFNANARGADGLFYMCTEIKEGSAIFNRCAYFDPHRYEWGFAAYPPVNTKEAAGAATSDGKIMVFGGRATSQMTRGVQTLQVMSVEIDPPDQIYTGELASVRINANLAYADPDRIVAHTYLQAGDGTVYDAKSTTCTVNSAFSIPVSIPDGAPSGYYKFVTEWLYYESAQGHVELGEHSVMVNIVAQATVREQMEGLQEQVEQLQEQLSDLENETADLRDQIEDIGQRLDDLENADDAIKTEVDGLSTDTTKLQASVDNKSDSVLSYLMIVLLVASIAIMAFNMVMSKRQR